MKTNLRLLGLGMFLMASAAAHAQQLPPLPQFQANTPALAAEVNANFETLRGGVNANEGRVGTLESSVANLPVGPVGPQGARGPAGAQGLTGATGLQGPAGPAGAACPPSTPRYTDNLDGTICDGDTGLMWEQKLAADDVAGNCADATQDNRSIRCVNNTYAWTTVIFGTEPDGTLFTDFLARKNQGESVAVKAPPEDLLSITQAGYTDWRIPNVVELQGILFAANPVNPICLSNPCIDGTFGPTQSSVYYSSSSSQSAPFNAWFVFFNGGGVDENGKILDFPARAVRGGR